MNSLKDRICLKCDGIFLSPGPHIRKCGTCLHDENGKIKELQNNWENQKAHITKLGIRKGKRTGARKDTNE